MQLVGDHSALSGYVTLKYSKGSEVFRARRIDEEGRSLDLVCRFNRGEAKGAAILGRLSRAERNLRRAVCLLEAGIDTAIPLARIERTSSPRSSWLVTEFVADVVDLDQIVLTLLPRYDRTTLRKVKLALSEELVELFARLNDARLYHRDLKASNILFTQWDGRGASPRPMIVDLDGLHARRWWDQRRSWQALVRLSASLRDYPALTRTDFARFLQRYLVRMAIPAKQWKAHFRRLARQAGEYAERSKSRKSDKLDGFSGA